MGRGFLGGPSERASYPDCGCWIAASALYYQVPLITNNAGDYKMVSQLRLLTEID